MASSNNCLHLLDISAAKAGAEHWLLHLNQWEESHSSIAEMFKVIPQVSEYLEKLLGTLLRLGATEAVGRALPRVWELLSRLASNLALVAHRDACERLLKCVDFFISETPDSATASAKRAHDWATRLLHGTAKVLEQINNLSRWSIDCGQSLFEMTDLIRDPRDWVASQQCYTAASICEPRDLAYLLDTCQLFVRLQRPSGIITCVLTCVSQLNDLTSPKVAAFLEHINSAMLTDMQGRQDGFWATVRAKIWQCHPVAFEKAVVHYAVLCIREDRWIGLDIDTRMTLLLREQGLLQACACSFALCYQATMMLRQLSSAASSSRLADVPAQCFHTALKKHVYALGDKVSFDLESLYASNLSEAAAVAVVPICCYNNNLSLKSRLSTLTNAVVASLSATGTAQAPTVSYLLDEIRCLFAEQHDWYWAMLVISSVSLDSEIEAYLDIPIIVHIATTFAECSMPKDLSDLHKTKSEILCCLGVKGTAEADDSTGSVRQQWPCPTRLPRATASHATAWDFIMLLRAVVSCSVERFKDVLCMLSPSSLVRLEVTTHLLQMLDLNYWQSTGVLNRPSLNCLSAGLDWCVRDAAAECRSGAPTGAASVVLDAGAKLAGELAMRLGLKPISWPPDEAVLKAAAT